MVYNFASGPAMLPPQVMQEAYGEFLDYHGSGMSVMEINHRSPMFNEIVENAKQELRGLLGISDEYEILFLQGGASLQFSAVPMNLMINRKAGFVLSGHWARRACEEAAKYGDAVILASSEKEHFAQVPDCSDLPITEDMDYVHICENNTIYGTEFKSIPDTKGKVLVADMSSCILSKPIEMDRYGLIYAGAQKNMGPAGVTIVIVRKDLIRPEVLPDTPSVVKYQLQMEQNSRYNTPPTFSIYLCGKVLKWLRELGGLETMAMINQQKAKLIYDYIDESKLFYGTAHPDHRSMMNATFTTGDADLDMVLVEDSKKYGFVGLKGHRFVGGLRASLYNAITVEMVEDLLVYLKDFEMKHI